MPRVRHQRIVNEDRQYVGITEVSATVDRSAHGRAIRIARDVVPDPAAMREQLAQRRAMVRLRERRQGIARCQHRDSTMPSSANNGSERGGDRFGATPLILNRWLVVAVTPCSRSTWP